MALIKCPECGKKISDKANVCIHCGYPVNKGADNQGTTEEYVVIEKSIQDEKSVKERKKVNRVILLLGVVAILVIIGGIFFLLVLKPSYEDAVAQYETVYSRYNSDMDFYKSKCEEIEMENNKLNTAIDELQKVVSSGEKPYDSDTIAEANAAINAGKIALVDAPMWEEKKLRVGADYNIFQIGAIKNDTERIKSYLSELAKTIETIAVPEYSSECSLIDEAKAALESSIKQMRQVTCPSEAFVLQRITNIRNQAGMKDVISLTEDNDPENYIGKAGWYTVKIVFHHKDVEHYGLDNGLLALNEVGNPAGGCVEVYRTEEDAQRRADQLKSQEGTERSPGARLICGTVVIRVSDGLKASYQQELLNIIADELLRMEEKQEQDSIPSDTDTSLEITPAFRELMDSYEKFFDEYIVFMKKFSSSDNVLGMMGDYVSYMEQYAETMEKINSIDINNLSVKDYAYYIEVQARINKKLLETDVPENSETRPNSATTETPDQNKIESSEEPESTTAITENKNEQAVKHAEEIANYYATVSPNMIKTLLVGERGFTEVQAIYGVQNANIDWNHYAIIHLEEYVGLNRNDGITKSDAEQYLREEKGYMDSSIEFAFANANVDWRTDEEKNSDRIPTDISATGVYIGHSSECTFSLIFYENGTFVQKNDTINLMLYHGNWTQQGSQITLEVQFQTFEETEYFNLTLYTDGIHFLDSFYTKTD